jgi:hypothetical protein
LVVAILLMGLAFRLVFFRSTRLSPVLEETPFAEKTVLPEETPIAEKTVPPKPPPVPTSVSVPVQENGDQVPSTGK